jgi:hypothetical protein
MPRAKKLTDLDVQEISGVDHPANLMEGWLVMKSRSGACPHCKKALTKGACSCGYSDHVQKERQVSMDESDLQQILEKAEQFQTAHEYLDDALQHVNPYVGDASPDVQDAIGVIQKHLDVVLEREATEVQHEDSKGRFAKFLSVLFNKSESVEEFNADEEVTEELTEEELIAAGWEPVEDSDPAEDFGKAWSQMCKSVAEGDMEAAAAVFDEDIIPILEENEDMEEFVKALVEELRAAVTPAEPVTDEAVTSELTKARDDLDATREALAKALDRIEALEGRTAARRSVDGQEAVEKSATKESGLSDAIGAALEGAKVTII